MGRSGRAADAVEDPERILVLKPSILGQFGVRVQQEKLTLEPSPLRPYASNTHNLRSKTPVSVVMHGNDPPWAVHYAGGAEALEVVVRSLLTTSMHENKAWANMEKCFEQIEGRCSVKMCSHCRRSYM